MDPERLAVAGERRIQAVRQARAAEDERATCLAAALALGSAPLADGEAASPPQAARTRPNAATAAKILLLWFIYEPLLLKCLAPGVPAA